MNMNKREGQQQKQPEAYGDRDKMYRRMTVLADLRKPSILPLVNIDTDNYMLRDISRPVASVTPLRTPDLAALLDNGVVADGIVIGRLDELDDSKTSKTEETHFESESTRNLEEETTRNLDEDPQYVEENMGLAVGGYTVINVSEVVPMEVDDDINIDESPKIDKRKFLELLKNFPEARNLQKRYLNSVSPPSSQVLDDVIQLSEPQQRNSLNCDFFFGVNLEASIASIPTTNGCARLLSFHNLLCSCASICCCNCGTSCSSDCHSCFHNNCSQFYKNYLCQKDTNALPPVTLDYDKPITEWTSSNVVEWMAALNLYTYSDVFRCKDIKGADLINLDRDKLIAMGIKDEFHQKAILTCIDELLNKNEEKKNPVGETGEGGSSTSTTSTGYPHNLIQHSFSTLERCDKCNKYLRGLLHQGFICQDCSSVAHRTCVATGLSPCSRRPLEDGRKPFFQFKSYFGQGLCMQIMPTSSAPLLLLKCVAELENKARQDETLELYNLYSATPPADQVNRLMKMIDSDINNLDLAAFSSIALAGITKKYLRELPDPVIPVNWYDKFLEAQRKKSDEECTSVLKQLILELPEPHRATLHFVMAHLCRICQMEFGRGNKNPPTVLIQVMCHILLRPPWDRIIQVVYNTQAHNRIIEILLLHCDWGEAVPEFASAPAIPPRKVSGRMGRLGESTSISEKEKVITLQEADWYWGDAKREEINERMSNAVDGTFCIRDASSKGGEYTLTLRKGGANKLIKICHRDGKYGFTEPYIFNSVVDLVNHFRNVSLSQYNTSLNIKLLYPLIKRGAEDDKEQSLKLDNVREKLEYVNKNLLEKQQECERVSKDFNETIQEIQTRRLSLNAFRELIKVFRDQTAIQEKFQYEAQPHEIKSVEDNSELLKQRLTLLMDSCEQLEKNLQRKEAYSRTLERELTSLKPEIHNLRRERERSIIWLLEHGVSQSEINKMINKNAEEVEVDITAHKDETSWLMPNSTREEAESLLSGKPDGTFLIRKSRNNPNYVLVVMCNGVPNHCIIYESYQGFGFTEPYNIYKTLKDLVIHYAANSLEMHNDVLNTVLRYPVGSVNSSTFNREGIYVF